MTIGVEMITTESTEDRLNCGKKHFVALGASTET